jgi:hypothetical protein
MGRRGKELSPDIRARLCELKAIRWTFIIIYQWYPDIPYLTIRSIIKQENNRKDQKSSP